MRLTFVWLILQELVEQLVEEWRALAGRVGQDIVMGHVVQSRYGVQRAAVLAATEERHRLRLRSLAASSTQRCLPQHHEHDGGFFDD